MARVLVVDDEKDVVELVKFLLERDGHQVIEAYNGREALERANAEHPDLIILDIWMPKKDGYQVIKELKADPGTARIPVIFLTASSLPQTLDKIKAAGGADYILKPYDPPVLMAKVKTVLEQKHV